MLIGTTFNADLIQQSIQVNRLPDLFARQLKVPKHERRQWQQQQRAQLTVTVGPALIGTIGDWLDLGTGGVVKYVTLGLIIFLCGIFHL